VIDTKILTLGLFSCLFLGCAPPPLEDVSNSREYSGVIGRKIRAKDELLAIGVTLDKNYKKKADYVLITPRPGFSGPEVVFTGKVSKGSEFRIAGVVKYGYFFLYEVHYVVEALDASAGAAPFHVKKSGTPDDPNLGLEKALFEKLT